MMDEQIKLMRILANTSSTVGNYANSDCSKAIVEMLDALIESYKLDLMHVSVEGLVALQASIRQTVAIRDVVTGDAMDSPKI